jgi:hypothetical protein
MYVISGFLHKVAENCTLLVYYAGSSGNFLRTFGMTYQFHPQGSRKIQRFLNAEVGTDKLSQNMAEKLPLLAA